MFHVQVYLLVVYNKYTLNLFSVLDICSVQSNIYLKRYLYIYINSVLLNFSYGSQIKSVIVCHEASVFYYGQVLSF